MRARLFVAALAVLLAIGCGGSPTSPPPPSTGVPAVATSSVTSIGQTAATLNGSVTPNGLTTEAFFEWGTTASYGNSTPVQSAGNGTAPATVTATLTGLASGTTYHYRLVGRNSAGTTNSPSQTFATSAAPAPGGNVPAAVTLPANGVGSDDAKLNASVTPNGTPTEAFFEWGRTTSYGNTSPIHSIGSGMSPVDLNVPVTGLSTNETYHYRIVARNSAGTASGADLSFTTSSTSPGPGPGPSGGAPTASSHNATDIGTFGATLNGVVQPNGNTAEAFFEWGTTASYGNTTPVQGGFTAFSDVSAELTGLSANTTYHFRMTARNSAGTHSGQDLTFRTGTNGAPPTVTTRPALSITQTSATLDSQIRPNALDTQVHFEWGTTTAYGNTAPSQMVPSGNTSVGRTASISGLTPNTTYHFRVVGTSSGGTSHGADLTFATPFSGTPPSATTNPATGVGQTTGTLHGTTNPNGVATNAFFEWGVNDFTNTTPLQPVSGSTPVDVSATLTGLNRFTTYRYRLVAQFNSGRTTGLTRTFTTDATGAEPFVNGEAVTNQTSTSVTLNGNVLPNGLPTTAWFKWTGPDGVERLTPVQSMGSGSGPVPITANVTGLIPNQSYPYRLAAENSTGPRETVTLFFGTQEGVGQPAVRDLGETNESSTTMTLNGRVSPNGLATEWFYEYGPTQSLGSTTAVTPIGSGFNNLNVTVQVTGLTPNTGYFYRLVARNSAGTTTSALQSAGTR